MTGIGVCVWSATLLFRYSDLQGFVSGKRRISQEEMM